MPGRRGQPRVLAHEFVEDGGVRTFYAKARIGAAVAPPSPYPVVHSEWTKTGSARTYLVLDVPPERRAAVKALAEEEESRVMSARAGAPQDLLIVSNEVPAVL